MTDILPNANASEPDDIFQESNIAISSSHMEKVKRNSDSFSKIFLFCLIVLLVILIFYYVFKRQKRQSIIEQGYNEIFGDAFDENVEHVLQEAEEKKDLRPIDNYRVGVIQIQNVGDIDAGNRFFRRAVNEIIDNPVDEDAMFIIGGLQNFRRADNIELFEVLDHARNLVLDAHLTEIKERKVHEMPKVGDKEYVQKAILAKQQWYSDSQNVHDGKMTEVMLKQFEQVKKENEKNGLSISYPTVRKYILENTPQEKYEQVEKTLDTMDRNIDPNPYVNEREILETVVARALDPENQANKNKIMNAVIISLAEGSNSYSTVCLTGRSKLIWQSLALLDKDPEIGIMKSTQMIRNEIIEKVAKIVTDEEKKESPETLQQYVRGETNEQIENLKARIIERIESIRYEYLDLANPKDLDAVLQECIAEIR